MPDDIINSIGNKKVKQKLQTFCTFLIEHKSKKFYICSHDNPDPDSLASCYGMLRITEFFGIESAEIVYCGEISHPQNRAMQNVLSIPVKKWDKSLENNIIDLEEKPVFVFIDCAGKQKNMSIPFEPSIAIDHHKTPAAKNTLFIHDEVGSCSTLITDLLLSIPPNESREIKDYCFDPEKDNTAELATSLAIGIKTDTLDFRSENTTDEDFRAYKFLSKFISDDKFHRVVNYSLPSYIFECEETAWRNKNQNAPNLITGLGFIEESKSDCVPYLADKMMRLQGIQTVMVYAIVGNAIRVSARTVSASIDVNNLLNEVCGDGAGGGKNGSGGANIPLGIFGHNDLEEEDEKKIWELTKSCIEKRFIKATLK